MTDVTTLLVMNEAEQKVFTKLLALHGINIVRASDCAQAREQLLRHSDIRVIVTALSLPDGNWWCIQLALVQLNRQAEIIVCLPDANHCVSEILARGAFAVVAPPFKARELRSLIAAAANPLSGASGEASSRAAQG